MSHVTTAGKRAEAKRQRRANRKAKQARKAASPARAASSWIPLHAALTCQHRAPGLLAQIAQRGGEAALIPCDRERALVFATADFPPDLAGCPACGIPADPPDNNRRAIAGSLLAQIWEASCSPDALVTPGWPVGNTGLRVCVIGTLSEASAVGNPDTR